MNSAIAASMTRLPPYRSPSQPDAGIVTARLTRKAIEMPSTAVALTPKSRPMVGRATLTIVASRMVMNIAATKTAPTATFWLIRGATASFPRGKVWPAASALQKLQDHARTGNSDAGPAWVLVLLCSGHAAVTRGT